MSLEHLFIVSMTLRNAKEKKLMTVYLEMLVQDNRIVNSGSLQQNIFQLLNKKNMVILLMFQEKIIFT